MTEQLRLLEDDNDRLIVVPFRHGPFWNFSYLLACPETHSAAVIDPAWNVPSILAQARIRNLEITTVLATHGHSDHVNGLQQLADTTGARVIAHTAEEADLRQHFQGPISSVANEESLEIGTLRVRILPTPGHSPGSLSFLANGYVFTGDALNLAGPGTPGPEPGSIQALWRTTQSLRMLPGAVRIHPGHDSGPTPHATVGAEQRTNPAFLANSFEEFVNVVERATGRRHRD